MKVFNLIAAMLMLSLPVIAQTTTPVTPVISNGQVQVAIQDSNGGTHFVTIPVSMNWAVGQGTDEYVPPTQSTPPPTPPPASSGAPAIPSNAIAVDLVKPVNAWKNTKDAGTPGTATFSNNYPVTGIFSTDARAFSISYTNSGGVRFSDSVITATPATHFVYDVITQSPDWTHLGNLEMDTNSVRSDGKTAILGTQCSANSKTWEITLSKASTGGAWHWVSTNLPCDPRTWTPNTPHHIRIFGTIDSSDVSTYLGVELDGKYSQFNSAASGNTGYALGWAKGDLVENYQLDGYGASGSVTTYVQQLTIYRW